MSNAPATRGMAAVLVGLVALSLAPRLATRRGHAAPPPVGPGAGSGSARPDDENLAGLITTVSPDRKAVEFSRKGPARPEPGMIALAIKGPPGEGIPLAWLEVTEVGPEVGKARVLHVVIPDGGPEVGARFRLFTDEAAATLLRLGDSGADNAREIGRRRVESARKVMDISDSMIENGTMVARDYLDASSRLLAAELAMAGSRDDRIKAIRDHMRRLMLQLGRELSKAEMLEGGSWPSSQDQLRAALAEAALLLNRERRADG